MSVVTVSCLGGFGRWGNQLFQYAFARAYAESIGAELLIPPYWVGRQLFKNIRERVGIAPQHWKRTETPDGRTEIDLWGYFQRPEHMALLSKKKLQEWFEPSDHMKKEGHQLVFHKRRGDYLHNGSYAIITDESYNKGARNFGYDPLTAKMFSDETSGEDKQYDDFFEMAASKIIFRANSSYSFWAGVLCKGKVYSPVVEDRTGWIDCDFVEGNHARLMYLFQDLHIKE